MAGRLALVCLGDIGTYEGGDPPVPVPEAEVLPNDRGGRRRDFDEATIGLGHESRGDAGARFPELPEVQPDLVQVVPTWGFERRDQRGAIRVRIDQFGQTLHLLLYC